MGYTHNEVVAAFPEYTVLPEMMEGGFKVAYRCEKSGEQYALKIVKEPIPREELRSPEEDEDADLSDVESLLPEKVRREMLAMKACRSPHLVAIVDGPDIRTLGADDHVWFVETWYLGGTLKQRLTGPQPAGTVLTLLRALLLAVKELEAHNLVHRDIKPGNIVFDEDDKAVLLDLGIALHLDLEPVTGSQEVSRKTNIYAAPEQFEIKKLARVDARTDLFAVGIVAFEALTGHHPFVARNNSVQAYVGRMLNRDVNMAVMDAVPDSDELKGFILRLLGPARSERFRNAERALDALERMRKS